MEGIYLDNAATTRLDERVLEKMLPFFCENFGNPSAGYRRARLAESALDKARARVAGLINARPEEIYFTSCGSESDNLAIKGIAKKSDMKRIISSRIEHHAVLESLNSLKREGFDVELANVSREGLVSLDEIREDLKKGAGLVSIMAANNEIGTIQPIEEIARLAGEFSVPFHSDAVQAIGSLRIDVKKMNIDSLSISAHKFHGPKGIGALYVRNGLSFEAQIDGGSQERRKRAGTENVAGAVGLSYAMELAYEELDKNNEKISKLRDFLLDSLLEIEGLELNGGRENRLCNNINLLIRGAKSQTLLVLLDKMGLEASVGSACTAGSLEASHVLMALGRSEEEALSSLRLTLGKENTLDEIKKAASIIKEAIALVRG